MASIKHALTSASYKTSHVALSATLMHYFVPVIQLLVPISSTSLRIFDSVKHDSGFSSLSS